jgi:N-acetylmuramoyl-L-alanine amidase
MSSAAIRLAAIGGLACQLAACAPVATGAAAEKSAGSPAVRTAPSRPNAAAPDLAAPVARTPAKKLPPLPVTPIKGRDYLALADVAKRTGFKSTWVEARRELTLSTNIRRLVLTAEKREVAGNGMRIFLGEAVQIRNGALFVSKTDYERCLLPLLRPDQVEVPTPRLKTIVLDPGHGGGDPGMENRPLKLQEKVLALEIALRLEKLLIAEGYSVVLTRRDDRQLAPTKEADLQRRALIANTARADLFISIHFNSLFPNTLVSGTEVYVFTRPGQRSDQSWGYGQADDTENEIAPVNRHDPWTALLAHSLHREIIAGLKTSDRGHKTKHLAVLRGLKCPGVLVEAVFLSNDEEARRAASPAYRQKIAESLAAGIRTYAAALGAAAPKSPPTIETRAQPSSSNSP